MVKLLDAGVKNVRATLVCQYGSELKFPIGVVASGGRVYVCDSGNNRVQVFEERTGRAALELRRDLQRPSAVLVCERRGEVYVKDDRQVAVFRKGGEFVRSFGANFLARPYG